MLTRETFEELIRPLVRKTLMTCRRALKDAGTDQDEVREVVMVGGSTRVPLVRELVGEFFSKEPLTSIDPTKWLLSVPRFRQIFWPVTNRTATCCCWM